MKRFLIVAVAALAAVLFTACPDKPLIDDETDDGYYMEEIAYINHLAQGDSTFFYTQTFKKIGNKMIYDPCEETNINKGFIRFREYCHKTDSVTLQINGDSIIYNVKFLNKFTDNDPRPIAKVFFIERGHFSFSYDFELGLSTCIHTCRRTESLSN